MVINLSLKCVGSNTKVFTSLHYIEQIEIIDNVFCTKNIKWSKYIIMKGIITEGSELGSIMKNF